MNLAVPFDDLRASMSFVMFEDSVTIFADKVFTTVSAGAIDKFNVAAIGDVTVGSILVSFPTGLSVVETNVMIVVELVMLSKADDFDVAAIGGV